MPEPEFTRIDLPATEPVKKKVVRKRKPRATVKKTSSFGAPEEKKMKQELKEIYQNDDGTMPNMSNFQKKKSGGAVRAFFTLIFACAFLGAVAWAGFFVFKPKSGFAEKDVTLSISGEEQIVAGQEVHYRVRYRNSQNAPLTKANLQLKYPEGFVFSGASKEPNNDKKDEWILGKLDAQASGYIDIQGKLFGDINKKQSFRAFLNYTPANFNSEFQKVANLNTEITGSPATITVTAPAEAVPGASVEFTVDIIRPSDQLPKNLAFVLEPAGGLSLTLAEPANDKEGLYQWGLAELSEKVQLKLKGACSPEEGAESADVKFKLLGWKDEKKQGEPYVFWTETKTVKLLKADLSAGLAVNGTMGALNIHPGEVLNAGLVVKNNGQTVLKNLTVKLVFETPSFDKKSMLDWGKLNDKFDGQIDGAQVNDTTRQGSITWTKRQIGGLANLAAGKELAIDINIPLKSGQTIDLIKFTTSAMTAGVEVKYESDGAQKLLSSNQINFIINSDLVLEVRDKVTGDSQDREMHNMDWIVSNSFHELKDIELSADIYGDVIWNDSALNVPAGEAKFDAAKKQLVWKIPSMPVSVDVLDLKFSVTINQKNPSQTNLTSKVKIKARDISTGQDIIIAGDEVLLSQ